uniref:GIY-YIG nuclease family protein n=1 Tax=Inquilinus sp. OTU3971 TaxID=3043855 RepID=UPI00313D481D
MIGGGTAKMRDFLGAELAARQQLGVLVRHAHLCPVDPFLKDRGLPDVATAGMGRPPGRGQSRAAASGDSLPGVIRTPPGRAGGPPLFYVYLIESISTQGQRYVGVTADLKQRLQEHNSGKSIHTSKFKPWRLMTYIAFSNRAKAEAFERYLKSGSGRAFANKRLW